MEKMVIVIFFNLRKLCVYLGENDTFPLSANYSLFICLTFSQKKMNHDFTPIKQKIWWLRGKVLASCLHGHEIESWLERQVSSVS